MGDSNLLRLALLLLFSGSLAAAEPKGIVFPSPPTPTPTPQPPGSALPVSPDRFFVVQSDVDLIPVVSGVGKVKFTIEQGPIRVRGIFADGNGQYETRTLTAKTLVFVDPVSAGDAELLMIPVGVKDEASIARQRVTVLDGPRPPPGPGPNPEPEPKPGPTAKAVYMAVIRDSAAITPKLAGLLGDTPFWNSFKTAGHEWDFYDDTPTDDAGRDTEAKKKGYLRLADRVQTVGQPFVPTLILLNKDTGDILKVIPLPADKTGVQTVVKEVVK